MFNYVSPPLANRLDTASSWRSHGRVYAQIAENYYFQISYKWELNDVAIWDNRVSLSPLVSSSSFFYLVSSD